MTSSVLIAGIVSPLATGTAANLEAVLSGRSGLRLHSGRWPGVEPFTGALFDEADLAARLRRIVDELVSVVDRYQPHAAAVEGIYFGANVRSAIPTAHARGAALVACSLAGVEVGEYTPMQIKQAVVGTGAADKRQVTYMVRSLLNLDHDPKPDHAADALACAICHANLWRTAAATDGAYVKEKGNPYA